MALTLRTAITANDTTFDVLGSDDLEAGDFKTIDSETVVIRSVRSATLAYSEAARYRVSVYRGAGGTRAAAHAANATLATFSGGGGVQLVTQLGPLNVLFSNAGITDDPATTEGLATVPEGSWVVSAWAVVRESWDDGSDTIPATLSVGLRSKTDAADRTGMISYEVGGSDPSTYARTKKAIHTEYPKTPIYSFPALAQVGDCWLTATVDAAGAPGISKGDIDVYALIATPVS